MATVTIGGRDFEVFDRQAPGGLGRTKKIILAEAAIGTAAPTDVPDRMADLVACYLDGVTAAELLELLPSDCGEVLRECIAASGGKVSPPGEGKSP